MVNGQELLIFIELKVFAVVVGEVVGVGSITDDKELDEAHQRFTITVAGGRFVIDDLFHSFAGGDTRAFELDLHHG